MRGALVERHSIYATKGWYHKCNVFVLLQDSQYVLYDATVKNCFVIKVN